MPFKWGLLLMILSIFSTVQAATDALPMDLIELLGELDDDNQDSFDQDSLDAAIQDKKKPALLIESNKKLKLEVKNDSHDE